MSHLRSKRNIRLATIDDLVVEIDRIASAVSANRVTTIGNWTPAQIFEHLAKLIEFSYDGAPFRVSWPVWAAGHVLKWVAWKQFIDWCLRPGYQLPAVAAPLLPSADADFEPSMTRLLTAVERIRSGESMLAPSPFEGRLTHEQWVYVHLRHAELHLGFIQYHIE